MSKKYNKIPFLRIIVPLCAGVITGLAVTPNRVFFIVAAIVAFTITAISFLKKPVFYSTLYGVAFSTTMFLTGLLLYTIEKNNITSFNTEETTISGVIDEYPVEKAKTYQIVVKLTHVSLADSILPASGSLLLYHQKEDTPQQFLPGDHVVFKLSPIEITNRGNPSEFDYKFYMENQGIKYMAFTNKANLLSHQLPKRRHLRHDALIVREKLIDLYEQRGIEGNQLSIIAAISLGRKDLLDPDQEETFNKAGIMHVMAVSGLHAGIVSMLVMGLLFFMKGKWHTLRILLSILSLWCFAFITGLAPSVMRASLMFTFLNAGNLLKRPVNSVNSVLASALILIVIHPSVIFSTGFQLSYLAVLYIIIFCKYFTGLVTVKNKIVAFAWNSAVVTIIAQLGTLPLTIAVFNRFPTWFILSNVVILPIATITLIAGLLVLITFPLPFISIFIATIANNLAWFTEYLTAKAASLPLSTINNIGMTSFECIFLIIVMFLTLRYIINHHDRSPLPPLVALLCFIVAGTITDYRTSRCNQLIVYNTIGYSTVGLQTGKTLHVVSDTLAPIPEVDRHSSTLRLNIERGDIEEPFIFSLDRSKVLVTERLTGRLVQNISPDIVVLKGKKPVVENDISQDTKLKVLIISNESAISYQQRRIISKISTDSLHYVKNDGAFIYRFNKD